MENPAKEQRLYELYTKLGWAQCACDVAIKAGDTNARDYWRQRINRIKQYITNVGGWRW